MKPYSKDLRLRVLSAVDAGKPREQVAKTFSVSMPTIKRWLKRRKETGDVEPEPIPGRPSRKGAMLKEWLPIHLQANDDLTLEEHRQAFEEEFGEEVSTSTIGRAIAGLPNGGWPLKKVTHSLRARRASQGFVAVAGFPLRRQAPRVLKDESGFNTSMTRLRARAPRGKRAYGKVPRNLKARTPPSSPRSPSREVWVSR
jgi:transposase